MGNKPFERGRAWVEVDLNAITHNLKEIRSKTPESCELMAVLKADAYGHGVDKIARRMIEEGVTAYAVATLAEGLQLRSFINNEMILVLGRTHPQDAVFLHDNNLTQIIIDAAYAKELNDKGFRLNVHIAINTQAYLQP